MKPLVLIERTLAVIGAVTILALLTGQAGSANTPAINFLEMGRTYVTDTNDTFTPIQYGGANWVKANATVGGNRTEEPVWVNLTRYTWVQQQQ